MHEWLGQAQGEWGRITWPLACAAHFFICVLRDLEPIVHRPLSRLAVAVVLYTDAEWSPLPEPSGQEHGYWPTHSTGLGSLCFAKPGVYATAGEAPATVIGALRERVTQIIPLELLAAAGALVSHLEHLRGRDVILFIDNQSVCFGIAKGASRAHDIVFFLCLLHALCRQYHIGLYVEWVRSEANPADELSRKATSPFCSVVERMLLPAWSVFAYTVDAVFQISALTVPFVCTLRTRLTPGA